MNAHVFIISFTSRKSTEKAILDIGTRLWCILFLMPNNANALVLNTEELPVFNDSSFFRSLDAIDSFFERTDTAVTELQDDQLLNLFSLVNQLGNRAWMTRAIIIGEIANRTKAALHKEELTKEEFREHVAKALDIARSTAYEDIQILKKMREEDLAPRLDRTFYKLALTAPNFKEAIAHAEDEYDSLGGKYTTQQFSRWVDGEAGKDLMTTKRKILLEISPEELNTLVEAVSFLMKNDPSIHGGENKSLYQKLLDKVRETEHRS